MLLSVRMLDSVGSVNDFDYVNQLEFSQGDSQRLYFQLIDASRDRAVALYQPAGRRYVPAAGATLSVTLDNIDDAKKCTRAAVQPFPGDGSIWYMDVLSTDKVSGTVNMQVRLTEGSKVTTGRAEAVVLVHLSETL